MFYTDSYSNRYYIGRPFVYNGQQYTRAGASHATFMSLGFTQVLVQPRPDDDYYIVSGPDVTGAYTSVDRNLADLKTNFKFKQKKMAHDQLVKTDWYIIRNAELGATDPTRAAIPTAVPTFRSGIRTAADERCAQIDACTTVAELETLMKAPAQLYNQDTETFYDNPDALTPYPTYAETFYSF